MKTSILNFAIVAFLLLAPANIYAEKPYTYIPFDGRNGIEYIPVEVEEAPDSLPVFVRLAILREMPNTGSVMVFQDHDLNPNLRPKTHAETLVSGNLHISDESCHYPNAKK